MPEPIDAIMPILQRIQADIGDLKRDLGSKIDGLSIQVKDVSERMDAFEDYFTFTMGVTQQNKADLARLGSDVRAIKSRVDALEDR